MKDKELITPDKKKSFVVYANDLLAVVSEHEQDNYGVESAQLLRKNFFLGNFEFSKELLENRVNPNIMISNVIYDNATNDSIEEKGTVLFGLCGIKIPHEKNLYDIVELLLQHNADPTIEGYEGDTKMLPIDRVVEDYTSVQQLLKNRYRKIIKSQKALVRGTFIEQLIALSEKAITLPRYNEPCERLKKELIELGHETTNIYTKYIHKLCDSTCIVDKKVLPKDVVGMIFGYVAADKTKPVLVRKKTILDVMQSVVRNGGIHGGLFKIGGTKILSLPVRDDTPFKCSEMRCKIHEPIYTCYMHYFY